MSKKFFFDTDRLVFIEEQKSFRSFIKHSKMFIFSALSCAIVITILSYIGLINSPQTALLRSKSEHLVKKMISINERFDSISEFIAQVQHRDDECYRVISQKEPISSSFRQAGFGGINNYENLEGFYNSELLINSTKRGDILINQLKVQTQSYDTLVQFAQNLNDSLLSAPAIPPMAPHDFKMITSPFGWRMHPVYHQYIHHDGIDFSAEIGQKIYCTGFGVVVSADDNSNGYGRCIVINHGFGYFTRYGHMSKILVHVGDTVYRGTLIGKVGNTGTSTGPHLHYEVIHNGEKQDPANYYLNDLSQSEYKGMVKQFNQSN